MKDMVTWLGRVFNQKDSPGEGDIELSQVSTRSGTTKLWKERRDKYTGAFGR